MKLKLLSMFGLSTTYAARFSTNWKDTFSNENVTFEFMKTHGCNCPALQDEFAIGGYNTTDETDLLCRDFRNCMKCVDEHTDCANQNVNDLGFNWTPQVISGQATSGYCDSVTGCAAKKCSCHINFFNGVMKIHFQGQLPTVGVPGRTETCSIPAATNKQCCYNAAQRSWTMFDDSTHECSASGTVEPTPAPTTTPPPTTVAPVVTTHWTSAAWQVMSRNQRRWPKIDPSYDYTVTFDFKANYQTRPNEWRSIYHLGNDQQERFPALYLLWGTQFDLHFSAKCQSGANNNAKNVVTGWSPKESHKIQIRWRYYTERKAYLYIDDVWKTTINIGNCAANKMPSMNPYTGSNYIRVPNGGFTRGFSVSTP